MLSRMPEAGRARATADDPRPLSIENVGRRLREQRERRKMSLRELARRIELSPSAISQIETGKSLPSVSTLYAIVTELGVSLDGLFEQGAVAPAERPPAKPPVTADRAVVQPGTSRTAIEFESGVRWEQLAESPEGGTDFLYVVYDVGGTTSRGGGFMQHAGREFGLVLSGTLEVVVGSETHLLGPGDSISYASTTPHSLRNAGAAPVHGVWVVIGRGADERAPAIAAAFDR